MKPNDRDTLIHWLFATRALRAAPADEPFWYTSGTLGPLLHQHAFSLRERRGRQRSAAPD